jgi:hypothetical protein
LMVLLLGLSGCRTGGSHDDAAVRLINATPETDDLSVAVDGQRVWKHSSFRSNSGFQGVGAGTYKVEITARQNGQRQTGDNYIQCEKGKAYTVVALSPQEGTEGVPGLRIFADPRDASIPFNQARLCLINAGDGLGHVDALFNNIVGLGNVAYGARSSAISLAPGMYDVKINATDEVPALVGPSTLRFQGGHAYTLVVMGRAGQDSGPQSLTLESYPDDQ